MTTYERRILDHGALQLRSTDGSFSFTPLRPGVLLIRVFGHDKGQFGPVVLDEITATMMRDRPLTLFIDARSVVSIAYRVQGEWSRFFASNRHYLAAVHVLAGSSAVRLTIAIASHWSRTGDLIRVHDRAASFERLLQRHTA